MGVTARRNQMFRIVRALDLAVVVLLLAGAALIVACQEEPVPPILDQYNHRDPTESGWKRSDCFECHTHDECPGSKPEEREPDCVKCHGYNGARDYYHLTDQDCYRSGCHDHSHAGQDFLAPDDCKVCHYHGGY